MKLCSRCRSDNNGDLKFCNYCGARLRTLVPYDCYGGAAPMFKPAQVVPASTEVTDAKLAYRYFLKGKHAFAAGDLDRATLMFQCALDANPADQQVKAFLLRVTEMKNKSKALEGRAAKMRRQYGLSSASVQAKDLAFTEARERVESQAQVRVNNRARDKERLRVIKSVNKAPVAVNPPKEELPKPKLTVVPTTKAPAAELSPVCQELLEQPEVVKPVVAEKKIPPRPAWLDTPAVEGREDFETLAEQPLSPSEYLDYAPESDTWKDMMASGLVIFGLAVFGWVLVM